MERRQEIIKACFSLIAEHGIKGLTQPRVAAAVGLKQGHLTYYYPTRAHLIRAVAETLMEQSLAPLESSSQQGVLTCRMLINTLVTKVCDHTNTRFLLALAAMSEEDKAVQQLVQDFELKLISRLNNLVAIIPEKVSVNGETLHALVIGLAIQGLSTGRQDMEAVATRVLTKALEQPPC